MTMMTITESATATPSVCAGRRMFGYAVWIYPGRSDQRRRFQHGIQRHTSLGRRHEQSVSYWSNSRLS